MAALATAFQTVPVSAHLFGIMFPLHHESVVVLNAPVAEAFEYLDDFRQLSAHMEKSSAMMMGSRMAIELDDKGGRVVGSKVRMSGKMLGLTLALDEVVTERVHPLRKSWTTVEADLIVIGRYRLGFELAAEGNGSRARIYIDYALPDKPPARWLGMLFAASYARWCTRRMAADAAKHFHEAGSGIGAIRK